MTTPSILANQAAQVADRINEANDFLSDFLIGGFVSDGGTTQSTGAAGALNFDADATAIAGLNVNGVWHDAIAAATDLDADAATGVSFGATSGKSIVFAVVVTTGAANATTPAWVAIPGTVADTGFQVPPTDAEVTEALAHANWVRAANMTVNRTGDLTVTVAVDNQARPGVEKLPLATTEAELRS